MQCWNHSHSFLWIFKIGLVVVINADIEDESLTKD